MRRVVYTCLLGGYEQLNEQPVAASSEAEFVCFTDDPTISSESWTIEIIEPFFPADRTRSQRHPKILGHERLRDYDELLYIDNTVILRTDPNEFVGRWLESHDLALVEHSYRAQVIDEFDEVVRLLLDDPARVHEQLFHYAQLYPDILEQKPTWNGMFAWRRSDAVTRFQEIWYAHVLRYSRRDQLSTNVALHLSGLVPFTVALDNYDSEVHRWPEVSTRNRSTNAITTRSIGPLIADLARERRARDELTAAHHNEIEGLRAQLTTQQATQLATSNAVLAALRSDNESVLASLALEIAEANAALEEIRASTSWRVTGPLRGVATRLRRRS